jgi:hypothetical protein
MELLLLNMKMWKRMLGGTLSPHICCVFLGLQPEVALISGSFEIQHVEA